MAELFLDVHLEIDPFKLAAEHDPAQAVAELARGEAEVAAMLRGVRLRHSVPIDVYTRPGLEPLSGQSVLLVATRWVADGPEVN